MTTPAKHKGGGGGTTGGAKKRDSGAEQPQGTEATRVNAEQDTTGRKTQTLRGGAGHNCWQAHDTRKQTGGQETTSGGVGTGGLAWGGARAAAGGDKHQCTARSRADTRKRRVSKGKRAAGQRHPRKENTGWCTARAREAGPSDPARTKWWRTTRAWEADPSLPARQTPQTTNTRQRWLYGGGDNNEPIKQAEHQAGDNTTKRNQTTPTQHAPPKGVGTHKHSTPQQGGATHQHSTNSGQANNTPATATHPTDNDNQSQPPPLRRAGTNTARPTTRGATHQHGTPHHGGNHAQTQHAPTGGGGHAPAQHQLRPGKHHRQPTPDNAGLTAAETIANEQNKPSGEPATTPRNETKKCRHNTPHQARGHARTRDALTGGGHAPAQHQPRRSKQHTRNRNPPNRQRQPNPTTTTAAGRNQHSTPHHEGGHTPTPHAPPWGVHTPTQHAPPWGEPRTNTARGNRGGGHAPAQHQPRPGKHHRQPTPDNAGRTAAETTANQQNKPSIEPATTPQTETRTRRHRTPHRRGGHAQTRHAPTGAGARTSTAPILAKQATQP